MKKTIAVFSLLLLGLSAPVAQAQAVPPAPAAGSLAGGVAGAGVGAAAAVIGGIALLAVVIGNDESNGSTPSSTD